MVGAVLLIGSYTFLPALAGSFFGQTVRSGLGLATAPEVELKSEPPPALLAGEFAEGQVVMGEADFEGVRPDRVVIDLEPFELDVLRSMRSGNFETREPLSGSLRMELSEDEVARIAESSTEDVPVEEVRLEPGRMFVELGARVLGVEVPVSVEGDLELRREELAFEPRRVQAFGVPVPERLSERLVSQADFAYPLDDLPYDARISEVRLKKDRLVLSGDLESIPLGGSGG